MTCKFWLALGMGALVVFLVVGLILSFTGRRGRV